MPATSFPGHFLQLLRSTKWTEAKAKPTSRPMMLLLVIWDLFTALSCRLSRTLFWVVAEMTGKVACVSCCYYLRNGVDELQPPCKTLVITFARYPNDSVSNPCFLLRLRPNASSKGYFFTG